MNVFLDEALRLASLGYHVFQCVPKSKLPFAETAPGGCNAATGDPATIVKWWTAFPDCNIGLKCDNLLVIDVDNKNGRKGNADFSTVMDRLGPVQTGPVSQSGNYGYHLLFRRPDVDVKGSNGLTWDGVKTGIDIRVGNQYIVAPPSIHPDTGLAYQWKTPPCRVCELPALPDAWIEYFLPHRQRKPAAPQSPPGGRPIPPSGSYNNIDRCRAYLDKVDPSIAGQGGDNQLFKAACVIFWDFGLSESDGMTLLNEFNARCRPPWPPSRLTYKMNEALKPENHDKPRGHLLDEERQKDYGVDLSGILIPTTPPEPDDEPDEEEGDPGHVPESLLRVPGFVGEVMDFTLENAPCAVPTTAFCGAMALQSFLCGRKVREPGDLRTNLYLLALVGASSGKDYPRKVNAHILYLIGEEKALGDKFVSGEGLQDSLFLAPNMLYQNDEIDGLLYALNDQNRRAHVESIMGTLLTLYTSASVVYPMRRKSGREHPGVVDQPHLTLFGTATPQFYYAALSERMMTNGFFARMIIVDADKRPFSQDAAPVDRIGGRIIETARWWKAFQPGEIRGNLAAFHPTPVTVPFEPATSRLMLDFRHDADEEYSAAEDRGDVVAMTVWGRANENARKLALLYACSENHRLPSISLRAGRWAAEFVSHQIKRQLYKAKEFSSKTRFQALCKEAIRHVRTWHRKHGRRGIPRWQLKRQLGVTPREFDDLLAELDAQRYIRVERTATSGRPQETIALRKI